MSDPYQRWLTAKDRWRNLEGDQLKPSGNIATDRRDDTHAGYYDASRTQVINRLRLDGLLGNRNEYPGRRLLPRPPESGLALA
mgnify:CR=1 FL=1